MVLNQQTQARVDLTQARVFVARLRRSLALRGCDFNVCFVDDARIRQLNAAYRHKPYATDVLSFPWGQEVESRRLKVESQKRRCFGLSTLRKAQGRPFDFRLVASVAQRLSPLTAREAAGRFHPSRELDGFLGDIVISAEMARRNAAAEGHAARTEICWLILHGLLHLLGYDHETDGGEMTALEQALRERLQV
jgi:rRNA maturation RNase YbeY